MLGLLSRSPRHSRTVSDGDAPVVPTGTVSYYGKLDTWGAFVTVLPPLRSGGDRRVSGGGRCLGPLGFGNLVRTGVSKRVISVRLFLDSVGVGEFGTQLASFPCFIYSLHVRSVGITNRRTHSAPRTPGAFVS